MNDPAVPEKLLESAWGSRSQRAKRGNTRKPLVCVGENKGSTNDNEESRLTHAKKIG